MTAGDSRREFRQADDRGVLVLTLVSADGMNRLTRRKVIALREEIEGFCGPKAPAPPLVITGDPVFSAGADLNEVSRLAGSDAWHSPRWVRS
jgi:enoyl-CoA hydratase/carnithine racemase